MKTSYIIAGLIVLAVGSLFFMSLAKSEPDVQQETATTTSEDVNLERSGEPVSPPSVSDLPAPTAPDTPVSSDGSSDEAPSGGPIGVGAGGGVSGSIGAEPAPTRITAVQLQSHNSASSCWVVFRGSVYDVTAWLSQHPGGVQAIAQHCGTLNFEAAFMGQHGDRNIERFYQETTLVGQYAG
jgi:cytochrome b involved in lipid metabolism